MYKIIINNNVMSRKHAAYLCLFHRKHTQNPIGMRMTVSMQIPVIAPIATIIGVASVSGEVGGAVGGAVDCMMGVRQLLPSPEQVAEVINMTGVTAFESYFSPRGKWPSK